MAAFSALARHLLSLWPSQSSSRSEPSHETHPGLPANVEFTELARRARSGDQDAVDALIQLAEPTQEEPPAPRAPPAPSALQLAPSILALTKCLRDDNRTLSSDDRHLARQICLELSAKADLIPLLDADVSTLPRVMDRVVLYEDSTIVIRAHLFHGEASETFIHNHGQAMISTCLEGSYTHNIFQIDEAQGHHFRFTRRLGGIFEAECDPVQGAIENVVAQPFDAGQSLFISALAKHTVVGTGARVSTLTIRDARKRFQGSHVVSSTPQIEEASEPVEQIVDRHEQQRIKANLQRALVAFQDKLVPRPMMAACLENVSRQVEANRVETLKTQDMVAEVLRVVSAGAVHKTEACKSTKMVHSVPTKPRSTSDHVRETAQRDAAAFMSGVVFCGRVLSYLILRTSGGPDADVVAGYLRADCLRMGVPEKATAAFFNGQPGSLQLLQTCMPRQHALLIEYFSDLIGDGQCFQDHDHDFKTIESRLRALQYPVPAVGEPLDIRACILWLVKFAKANAW